MILVGLMCAAIWYSESKNIIYLSKQGISTKARVDRVDEVVSSTSYSDIYYHVSFWVTDNSKLYDDSFFKKKMHFTRLIHFRGAILEEGQEIQIKYDPEDPDNIIFDFPLKKHLWAPRSSGLLIMALSLIIGGAYFLRRHFISLKNEG